MARDISCQARLLTTVRGQISNALGISAPAGANKYVAANYKIRVAVRAWELSQETTQTPQPPVPEAPPVAEAAVEVPEVEIEVEPSTEEIPPAPVLEEEVDDVPEEEAEVLHIDAVFEDVLEVTQPEESVETRALAMTRAFGEVSAPFTSPPPIITKANLGLWAMAGCEKKLLDSSSPTFDADLQALQQEGYELADGDNVISPNSDFKARVILTLVRRS